ncbi:MAG: M23 family peptidase, partial [Leucobacter sp.]
MRSERVEASTEDCGCAPTPAEQRAFWPSVVNRRTALGVGALGIAGAALLGAPSLPAAYAANYPSWDDVEKAKRNESAKASEIRRIEGLIQSLTENVRVTQEIAEQRAAELFQAQQDYFEAVDRAEDLQAQADEQSQIATDAADKAARLALQLYRNGGDDASLQLLFAGSAAGADDLLARLGTMDKLLERNQDVYAAAVTARDSAQALSDQAEVARAERDRLQKVAEEKMAEAQAAADAAQAALDAQTAHLADLQAQLAALKDTTTKTVASYQAGVEAERKAREAREAEAKRKA